jgi:hypothetical protein
MYFNKFPTVPIDAGDGVIRRMTDLTRRVRLLDIAKVNYVSFDYYDVKSGETPEYIAWQYYGDAELHWVVLLANDIVDYYNQWPMSVPVFERYVASKYDDVNGIHHYEYQQESGDTTFTIELPNESATTIPVGATAVTNYEYEESIQAKNRRIRLIQPEYISTIKKEFETKIRR